jgi:hypothetical protein
MRHEPQRGKAMLGRSSSGRLAEIEKYLGLDEKIAA